MNRVTLDIEKPATGGRMLARHQGQVVLVEGAIPGERVVARIQRAGKGVVFAEVIDVVTPSADRRVPSNESACGGHAFAHIAYPRQLQLKGEIIQDAFRRIGRVALPTPPDVIGSPERGYRMRARLHGLDGRIGYFREGTHELCDAASTGQLLPATCDWLAELEHHLRRERLTDVSSLELAEDLPGDVRVCHLNLAAEADPRRYRDLALGLTGVSAQCVGRPHVTQLGGITTVSDRIRVRAEPGAPVVELGRDARAFFQSNRFLIEPLVWLVTSLVPPGPVIDLYAGVGLFGLVLAANGLEAVTAVEGHPISSANLARNAAPFGGRVVVERRSVEAFLGAHLPPDAVKRTVIVDPPRTGLSKQVVAGLTKLQPTTLLYVSCDVPTLARDARALIAAGYRLERLQGLDLFPNTAHVETVAQFRR